MKKILLNTLCIITLAGLAVPTFTLARERQDRGRGTDSATSDTGVSVQSSVVISSSSGNNDGDGDVSTGNQNANVTIETTVNGEVVQTVEENSSNIENDDRRSSRTRSHTYEDREHGVTVDTDVVIDNSSTESNETGNQNADGADGADGEDGADGDSPNNHDNDNSDNGDNGDSGSTDRGHRDRTERDNPRATVALLSATDVWSEITHFFTHVLALFLA